MSALNYSKKQIQPLIDKYAINAETNTTFARIIEMFDGQPNYQLWGVKVVFSKATTIENLEAVKDWADRNGTLIKKLSKNGNIISYSSSADFAQLRTEMTGLSDIAFVKNMISAFNTSQRKILNEGITPDAFDGLNCHKNANFDKWFKLFQKFNRLSGPTKATVIGRMSAVRSLGEIESLLTQSLKEKYAWNKEDLLSFVENNTPACDVVFNDGNIVLLEVKNYQDSNTLCYGRTSWCITSSDSQWKNYVTSKGSKQYFLFDFSKPEKDELAHVAFTVHKDNGITNAHSKTDQCLLNSGINYHGKYTNIQQALSMAGIGLGLFLKLKKNTKYTWNEDKFLEFVKAHTNDYSIAYHKDHRIIVNIFSNQALSNLCGHTYVKVGNMPIDKSSKCYALLDFNKDNNDDKSIVAIYYKKDNYNIDTLNQMWDAYGTNLKDYKYLSSLGIPTEAYLNREKVNPNILLHKLIDEGDDEGVCKLIDKEADIDINFEFNGNRPIFKAIDAKMHMAVGKIISNKKFDCNVDNDFGESLIQDLMFTFYLDATNKSSDKNANNIKEMINAIMDSKKFDLNYVDDNDDTIINIACVNPNMLWMVEKLVKNKDIDINHVNDLGYAALGEAIRHENLKAIELLGKRPDLKVLDKEKEIAKKKGIDLNKYLKPSESIFETPKEKEEAVTSEVVVAETTDADKYNEIFKRVFST